MTEDADITTLLEEYGRTALEWDAAAHDASKANELFDRNHSLFKRLRDSAEGREGIVRLMSDASPGIRLLAATHSLGWRPKEACGVLHQLEQSGGLHAVSAKHTLRSYRSGNLKLDW